VNKPINQSFRQAIDDAIKPHISRETSEPEISDDTKIPGLDITVKQARSMRGEEFLNKHFRRPPEL